VNRYAAAPLTDDQRAEVLRVMAYCVADERHAYVVHVQAERDLAQRELGEFRNQTNREVIAEREAELRGAVQAFDRALELLGKCWPNPGLGPVSQVA